MYDVRGARAEYKFRWSVNETQRKIRRPAFHTTCIILFLVTSTKIRLGPGITMADRNPLPTSAGGPGPKSASKRNLSSAPGKAGGRSRYASRACQECRRRRAKVGQSLYSFSRIVSRPFACRLLTVGSVTAISHRALDVLAASYLVFIRRMTMAGERPRRHMSDSCKHVSTFWSGYSGSTLSMLMLPRLSYWNRTSSRIPRLSLLAVLPLPLTNSVLPLRAHFI